MVVDLEVVALHCHLLSPLPFIRDCDVSFMQTWPEYKR